MKRSFYLLVFTSGFAPVFGDITLNVLDSSVAGDPTTWREISSVSGTYVNIARPNQVSAANIASNMQAGAKLSSTGWYSGCGNLDSSAPAISDSSSVTSTGFTYQGRTWYNGGFVALTLKFSDLIQASGVKSEVSSITTSFDWTTRTDVSNTSTFYFYLWDNTNGAVEISSTTLANAATGKIQNLTLDLSEEAYKQYSKTDSSVILLWNNYYGDSTAKISNLSVGANLTQVPEPATTTLSLLTIMGLCSRRRRKM
ncbi:MAG: PEP-CTERM sorting domain-containing protein [Akkermansia muciniphila]|nr:PEP-CTERM sorting domain-containing protein [Akkermansia muciniphila]